MKKQTQHTQKPDWRKLVCEKYKLNEQKANTQPTSAYEKQKSTEQNTNFPKFEELKYHLYEFFAGYKQNSGIYINNFFRKRDYKTYCDDKFHMFDFDISGIMPNVFDNFAFSMSMTRYLDGLEKMELAYFPITVEYLRKLIAVYEAMNLLQPLKEDMILYRGCSTIKRNGVNGLVSTTTNRKIAEQFSRGTILKLHVPAGTKYINTRSIRPKEQQAKDKENELILPPCRYTILKEKFVSVGNEPNNHTGKTRLLEISVEPLDLLDEFLKIMENPPEEYKVIQKEQGYDYLEAKMFLEDYINKRDLKLNT